MDQGEAALNLAVTFVRKATGNNIWKLDLSSEYSFYLFIEFIIKKKFQINIFLSAHGNQTYITLELFAFFLSLECWVYLFQNQIHPSTILWYIKPAFFEFRCLDFAAWTRGNLLMVPICNYLSIFRKVLAIWRNLRIITWNRESKHQLNQTKKAYFL